MVKKIGIEKAYHAALVATFLFGSLSAGLTVCFMIDTIKNRNKASLALFMMFLVYWMLYFIL